MSYLLFSKGRRSMMTSKILPGTVLHWNKTGKRSTYKVTMRRFRSVQPSLLWKSNEYYIFRVCVFVVFGIQHAIGISHIVICCLPRSTIFFHIFSYKAQLSKKKLLNTKCVFWFSLQLLPETFLILRRYERDMIKMYISLHVKYPSFLPDCNET